MHAASGADHGGAHVHRCSTRAGEELKDEIRRRWAKLTDEDLDEIEGDPELLSCKLQELYGRSEDEATAEIELFLEPY